MGYWIDPQPASVFKNASAGDEAQGYVRIPLLGFNQKRIKIIHMAAFNNNQSARIRLWWADSLTGTDYVLGEKVTTILGENAIYQGAPHTEVYPCNGAGATILYPTNGDACGARIIYQEWVPDA
jgi:hypothetical protein